MLTQRSPGRVADFQPFIWKLLLTALGALALWITFGGERDQPIRYKVPSPKLPEKVEFLDRPSIKVRIPFQDWAHNRSYNTQTNNPSRGNRSPARRPSSAMPPPRANSSGSSTRRPPPRSTARSTRHAPRRRHGPRRRSASGAPCSAACCSTCSTTRRRYAASRA